MNHRKGKGVRLNRALQDWLRAADPQGRHSQAKAVSVWEEVAGEEVCRHTVGTAVRKGELIVHVDSHAWAAQLSLMADDFKQRINSALGENLVTGVSFTVSRTVEDERERARREEESGRRYGGEKVTPAPLAKAEMVEVERQTRCLKNGALKEAATGAQVRSLEWEKARKARRRKRRPSQEARASSEE